jgi:hypothetical protein
MLGQKRVLLGTEQLALCRHTPELEYALDDVTKCSFPGFDDYTDALINQLNTDPMMFIRMGLNIKQWRRDDGALFVAPLSDAIKFTNLLNNVQLPVEQTTAEQSASSSSSSSSTAVESARPLGEPMELDRDELQKKCRQTPDHQFSILDAVMLRDNCTRESAKKRYNQTMLQANPQFVVGTFQFDLRFQPTPVACLDVLLQILAVIPAPGAMRARTQTKADQQLQASNPVNAVELMQIGEDELRANCRTTEEGQISIYDALVLRDGGTLNDAGRRYISYKSDNSREFKTPATKHRFGSSQATPVAPFHEVLRLLAIIPGPGAARMRSQQAEFCAQAMADNMDLQQKVREQSQALSAVVPTPVYNQLMEIDHDELRRKCRTDPDGNISIFDALAWRDGCSLENARIKFFRWNLSGADTGSEDFVTEMKRSKVSVQDVLKYRFGSDPLPTPVAPFHEVLRLLAIIPGPGAARVRSQQAELSTRAMAGDWDLQQAIQDRRQALPAVAQELFMAGLESSSDAKRMREEQREQEETQAPKRPRLSYTGEQLIEFVKELCPAGPPNPAMLSQMWEQCDGTHEDFMAKFIKYCEVTFLCVCCLFSFFAQTRLFFSQLQITLRQFFADQRRLDEKSAAELKLQEHQITQELKLKAEQSRKELEQKAEQSRKELEQKAEQSRKELEQKAEQSRKELEQKAEQSRKEYELRANELELKKQQTLEQLRLQELQSKDQFRLQVEKSKEQLRLQDEKSKNELKLREEELLLKREQYKEELRLKIVELEFKKEQAQEGVRLQENHAKERERLDEMRLTEEMKIKEKESSASIKLLEQQTQTAVVLTNKAQKEVEAAELKNARVSKHRALLADSDRRRVLARVFPRKIGAKCEIVECQTYVSAFSCSILEGRGYTLGDIDRLLVVCAEHARLNRPRAHVVEHNRRKLETWLYRFGCSSMGLCALCGLCKLAVWHTETHTCHINAVAEGGGDALDNLVIGSVSCNQQQGVKPLVEYHEQIRVDPTLVKRKICVPEDKIEDAMNIMLRKHKGVCKKCPTVRLEALLLQPSKPKHVQSRLEVRSRAF